MPTLYNQLADLQHQFRALHRNYGKIPKWEFMLQSVLLVDKMELIEKIIKTNESETH